MFDDTMHTNYPLQCLAYSRQSINGICHGGELPHPKATGFDGKWLAPNISPEGQGQCPGQKVGPLLLVFPSCPVKHSPHWMWPWVAPRSYLGCTGELSAGSSSTFAEAHTEPRASRRCSLARGHTFLGTSSLCLCCALSLERASNLPTSSVPPTHQG